jgi:purine-binding chemotaxis protein CheW
MSATLQILHFKIQAVRFCVELHYVNKILPLVELENVPGSPAYVAGLMNIAGQSVPVIDLALRLGLKRCQPYHLDTPVILCADKAEQLAMIVDEIQGLDLVEKDILQMNKEFNKPTSMFKGTLTFKQEVSLLIDMNKVFDNSLVYKTAVYEHD